MWAFAYHICDEISEVKPLCVMDHTVTVSAALPPSPELSERLPNSPMFTGRKKDLPLFLTKLRFNLNGNADRFLDKASRIIYAHSRLDFDSATLINPLMDSHICSVDSLAQFLKSTYGDPNKELTT